MLLQHARSLQPFVDADAAFDLADYYAQFLGPLQQDGELWGLPDQASPLMLYVNLDRFAEAGLAPPALDWSTQDFLDAAAALSGDGHYGFTTREGAYTDLIFALERLGARLFDESQEFPRPTFDDPAVVAALEQYAGLWREGQLNRATPSAQLGWPDLTSWGGPPDGVTDGQVAMWTDDMAYQSSYVTSELLPFDVGAVPLPIGVQASTEFALRAYYVSDRSDAPQLCWEWLTFLSGRPEVVQWLPTRRSVAASPQWQERMDRAALPAYLATLEYADTSLFRLHWWPYWGSYTYPWLDEAFQAVVAGADAGRALGAAQAKIEEFVACQEAAWGSADYYDQLKVCARQVDANYPLPGTRQ